MTEKHSHCSYCGDVFVSQDWPRNCLKCLNITYRNPLPVAVLLVPIFDKITPGLLVVRRGIQPKRGELALPGGYLECDETWQVGAARELREETGMEIDPDSLKLKTVISSPTNSLLIFCETEPFGLECMDRFVANEEVTELIKLERPVELAFQSHTDVMRLFFDEFLSKS